MGKEPRRDPGTTMAGQIRRYRKERGMTQSGLAESADLSTDMISRVERGIVRPSLGTVIRISETLEVPLSVLFGGRPLDPEGTMRRERRLLEALQLLTNVETDDLPWIVGLIRSALRK
jgi:transcriptional regulator with XRE-family HTH domain